MDTKPWIALHLQSSRSASLNKQAIWFNSEQCSVFCTALSVALFVDHAHSSLVWNMECSRCSVYRQNMPIRSSVNLQISYARLNIQINKMRDTRSNKKVSCRKQIAVARQHTLLTLQKFPHIYFLIPTQNLFVVSLTVCMHVGVSKFFTKRWALG